LASVDREVTPWLVATWHAPWYSTYKAHYREAECMRVEMEDLLYKYGVDIVFNGHVSVFLFLTSTDEINIAKLRTLRERILVAWPIIVVPYG